MLLVHSTTSNCPKLSFRYVVKRGIVIEQRIHFAHRGANFLVGIEKLELKRFYSRARQGRRPQVLRWELAFDSLPVFR